MEIHIQFILQNNWLGLKMWNVRKQISCAMKCFNLRKLQSTCEKKKNTNTLVTWKKMFTVPVSAATDKESSNCKKIWISPAVIT